VSEAEHPSRLQPGHEVTVEEVRQLFGASTPHFALQLRNRIATLIRSLPGDHPARVEGEREIARLQKLAYGAEVRGPSAPEGQEPLPPLKSTELAIEVAAEEAAE
jgi:hypothetical protein